MNLRRIEWNRRAVTEEFRCMRYRVPRNFKAPQERAFGLL